MDLSWATPPNAGFPVAPLGFGQSLWFSPSSSSSWWELLWHPCFHQLRTMEVLVFWGFCAGPRRRTSRSLHRRRSSPSSSRLITAQIFCSNSWTITRLCLIFSASSSFGTTLASRLQKSYGTPWVLIRYPLSLRKWKSIGCGTDCSHFQKLILMVSKYNYIFWLS